MSPIWAGDYPVDWLCALVVGVRRSQFAIGIALVVDKGSEQTVKIVIYSKDTIDLTDQVIKEFDRTNK